MSIKIEKVSSRDVYDITVEETHNFFANGILVHNCMEILIPTTPVDGDEGEIALCTLASINWSKLQDPKDLEKVVRNAVRYLNNVLDYQDFLLPQSARSNENYRPLGVGITGLATWAARRGFRYGSPEMLAEVKRWMEHQYYYSLVESHALAIERGPCQAWKDGVLCYNEGVLLFEKRAKGADELTDFTPDSSIDWENIREKTKRDGVRNALLGAIAPVESSSVLIDSTNGLAQPKELVSVKDSKAGAVISVVPEIKTLRGKYQLMFDDPANCVGYLKTCAVLQAYICQSISADTPYNPGFYKSGKLSSTMLIGDIINFVRWGGKTNYYMITSKDGVKKALLGEEPIKVETSGDEEGECSSCIL